VPRIDPFGHGSPQSHADCRQVAQQPAIAAASMAASRASRMVEAWCVIAPRTEGMVVTAHHRQPSGGNFGAIRKVWTSLGGYWRFVSHRG
jgi:hypothetical protein